MCRGGEEKHIRRVAPHLYSEILLFHDNSNSWIFCRQNLPSHLIRSQSSRNQPTRWVRGSIGVESRVRWCYVVGSGSCWILSGEQFQCSTMASDATWTLLSGLVLGFFGFFGAWVLGSLFPGLNGSFRKAVLRITELQTTCENPSV